MIFVEGNYVYNLKINHPCRVVDNYQQHDYSDAYYNRHRYNRVIQNYLLQCYFRNVTDQHQADQQHDRMWTVIRKCRSQLLTDCIVRLYIYICVCVCVCGVCVCVVCVVCVCVYKGTALRIVIQSFIVLGQNVEIIKYKQL